MAMPKPVLPHDFEGWVQFLFSDEGGRNAPPKPGYRPSLRYMDQEEKSHWEVWPLEFFTKEGDVPENMNAPQECFARFWILHPELAQTYHKPKLKIGVEYELYEGSRKVAVGTVTKLAGILSR